MFEIYSKEQRNKISPEKVSSILITTGVHISSDAVELALHNNIDIVLMDKYGNPIGRFWHARMGSTARIRRAQLSISMQEKGVEFGLRWIRAKFQNQIDFLTDIRTRRTRLSSEITTTSNSIKESLEKINKLKGPVDELRQQILGIEGAAGKVYWDMMSQFVPEQFHFNGRSRHPAKDEYNAILNYGYGVLYGMVEKAIIIAGLDPYIGYIHADNYNKVSLVYDIIEKYRIWVEETILNMFSRKSLKKDMFEKLANGFSLGAEGKKVFIPALNEFLDQTILHNRKKARRRDTIQLDLHRFAQELLKEYGEAE